MHSLTVGKKVVFNDGFGNVQVARIVSISEARATAMYKGWTASFSIKGNEFRFKKIGKAKSATCPTILDTEVRDGVSAEQFIQNGGVA